MGPAARALAVLKVDVNAIGLGGDNEPRAALAVAHAHAHHRRQVCLKRHVKPHVQRGGGLGAYADVICVRMCVCMWHVHVACGMCMVHVHGRVQGSSVCVCVCMGMSMSMSMSMSMPMSMPMYAQVRVDVGIRGPRLGQSRGRLVALCACSWAETTRGEGRCSAAAHPSRASRGPREGWEGMHCRAGQLPVRGRARVWPWPNTA